MAIPSYASGLRQYQAGLTDSVWQLGENSRLQCSLNHYIPKYGQAIFETYAGKTDNLRFEIDMLRLPTNYSLAQVSSVPPIWKPGAKAKDITGLQWRKQFNGDLDDNSAWIMLTELEKGYFPTLYYQDWNNPSDRVSVAISAVGFNDVYFQFLSCRKRLLKYSFDDISYTVLNFKNNSSELDKASKIKLEKIKEYFSHDSNIEKVSVKAFSSSWGGRYNNLLISEKRAKQIKGYFVEFGIGQEKISVQGFGEKRHIASNKTEVGRAENRRVVIELLKP